MARRHPEGTARMQKNADPFGRLRTPNQKCLLDARGGQTSPLLLRWSGFYGKRLSAPRAAVWTLGHLARRPPFFAR